MNTEMFPQSTAEDAKKKADLAPKQIEAWRNFFIVCFCLAFSAFYELVEWWVAIFTNEAANDFLGTQGYIWDTQSDIFWALIGSILALTILRNFHTKQLLNIKKL